jgi:predicted RecB family nuclease
VSYFRDALVVYEGRELRFFAAEGQAMEGGSHYWHGPASPSTWLAVAVFETVRERAAGAPQSVTLELAAQAMGMTVEKLIAAIEWHEQYMRWHDGDDDYHVLER